MNSGYRNARISSFPTVTWVKKDEDDDNDNTEAPQEDSPPSPPRSRYELGVGKNRPLSSSGEEEEEAASSRNVTLNWNVPDPVAKPDKPPQKSYELGLGKHVPKHQEAIRTKRVIPRSDKESLHLKGALWDEDHYADTTPIQQQQQQHGGVLSAAESGGVIDSVQDGEFNAAASVRVPKPSVMYPDIDLSIPDTVYSPSVDVVWDLLRYEAQREAQREPLLVSFLHSTILNHDNLESALAFHLANKLSSPAMISTQIQSLVLESLNNSEEFRKSLRADIMAVRDRDPACTCLPDVFLYFKGFHALQTHRVGHYMYQSGRKVLAHYLQSQMSQNFQIDIHPNATMGSGIMLDHGTGIVVGETATVGHNCSILHHVTLGGSGKKGVDRHPKVGNGVLLGAGVSVLGNVKIGEGCQVGAGTLVISDLAPHSVAVGVPARIIGSFVDVTVQPSLDMNQMMGSRDFDRNIVFESEGI